MPKPKGRTPPPPGTVRFNVNPAYAADMPALIRFQAGPLEVIINTDQARNLALLLIKVATISDDEAAIRQEWARSLQEPGFKRDVLDEEDPEGTIAEDTLAMIRGARENYVPPKPKPPTRSA